MKMCGQAWHSLDKLANMTQQGQAQGIASQQEPSYFQTQNEK